MIKLALGFEDACQVSPHKFRKPCLDCGILVLGASRCDNCSVLYNRTVDSRRDKSKRSLYKGTYKQKAKEVRDNAEACWLCGGGYRADDPWQADHVIPDLPSSPLAAAHRSCNIRRALEQRNRKD